MHTVETIFNAARVLARSDRDGYLAEACGIDHSLRARVEALLQADAEASGFLIGPAGAAGSDAEVLPGEQVGERIDRYRLLE